MNLVSWCTFIISANIPSGFAYSAKTHSEETHEIPIDFDEGERSPGKIFSDIKHFLSVSVQKIFIKKIINDLVCTDFSEL